MATKPAPSPPPPPQLTALESERLMLLTAPRPSVPACDALSPRFPVLAYFVRMLAVLLPFEAAQVEELLTLYTMGWHCAPPPARLLRHLCPLCRRRAGRGRRGAPG